MNTENHPNKREEALRAENTRLHSELEQLRREQRTTMASVSEYGYRREAAEQQASELEKANRVLRRTTDRLAVAKTAESILSIFLQETITIAGASDGAILRRIDGTEFEMVAMFDNHRLVQNDELRDVPFVRSFREISRQDGAGYFARILQGKTVTWQMEELAAWFPEAATYFQSRGYLTAWDIPFMVNGEVAGYLGLAFLKEGGPDAIVAETITALANQIAIALEVTRLSEAEKRAAIAIERERAAQSRVEQLAKSNQTLRQSVARLANLQDISQFVGEVLLSIVEEVEAVAGGLFLYDSTSSTMQTRALVLKGKLVDFGGDPHFELFNQPVPMRDLSLAWEAVLTDPKGYFVQQVTVDDPGLAPGYAEWHLSQGHHSVAHFPLLCGEEPIGFFGLAFKTEIEITMERLELIAALGQQATLALELMRLSEADKRAAIAIEQERAAQQRANALERVNATLRESVGKLSQQTNVSVFLAETLGEIVRQMHAANGLILTVNEENRVAQLHLFHDGKSARWGMSGAELPLFASPFSVDVTPAFDIMCQEHQPICASRTPLPIPTEQFAFPGAMEYMMRLGASDSAIITLRAGGRVIGTLHLQFVDGTVLREEDEPLFVAMSQQAAIAMRLTELAATSQQSAVMEERNRLAQEIHDTLAHSFNSIKFLLEATESGDISPAMQKAIISQARELASEGAREARRSVWSLRPEGLERGDLLSALSEVIQQRTLETSLPIEIHAEGEPFALHPEVEDNLLRVVQEALANVTNHARAHRVDITLFYTAPELVLCVRDNGIGFVPDQTKWGTGFGLKGMRERLTRLSGHLHIVSVPGAGTEIRATVPNAQQRAPVVALPT